MSGGIGEGIFLNEMLFDIVMAAAETCNFQSWNDL
jgi:hypothetical protein